MSRVTASLIESFRNKYMISHFLVMTFSIETYLLFMLFQGVSYFLNFVVKPSKQNRNYLENMRNKLNKNYFRIFSVNMFLISWFVWYLAQSDVHTKWNILIVSDVDGAILMVLEDAYFPMARWTNK